MRRRLLPTSTLPLVRLAAFSIAPLGWNSTDAVLTPCHTRSCRTYSLPLQQCPPHTCTLPWSRTAAPAPPAVLPVPAILGTPGLVQDVILGRLTLRDK